MIPRRSIAGNLRTAWPRIRAALTWGGAALAAAGLAGLIFIAAVDAGFFRGPLIRFIAARTGREIRVQGAMRAHLLSLDPRIVAEDVAIGNPPWTPPGTMAQSGRVSLTFHLPGIGRSFGIDRLEMEAAVLHLMRDSKGYANWQWTSPDAPRRKGLPVIHGLSMPDAHVLLDDARRHLRFDGRVSAGEVPSQGPAQLRIAGAGDLNGRDVAFEILGDPLMKAAAGTPYHFTFVESGSGVRIDGRGDLPQPFDFKLIEASFSAAGQDLKDLYFLTGVTLVNTGAFHLSGRVSRRGAVSTFSDLAVFTGQSDVHGTVVVESRWGKRPLMTADLGSQRLRMSDLGARAAGREPDPAAAGLLLSTAKMNPAALRGRDAVVNFRAARMDVGRVPLRTVAARITLDQGVMVAAPLTAELLGGQLAARVKVGLKAAVPSADLDLRITDAQLGQLDAKGAGPPPIEGLIRAHVALTGRGSSVHEFASTANGALTAVLPRGVMRASLAELAGLDFRGLGLLLTDKNAETAIRCGVAGFQARDGTLTAQSVVLDTAAVLIDGGGTIHLDSEALDLELRGHPKKMRLGRVRSPMEVHGTLMHPSIGIKAGSAAAQTAAAIALGIVLTPLAAVLAFVDPGLAKNADCASLLSEAGAL